MPQKVQLSTASGRRRLRRRLELENLEIRLAPAVPDGTLLVASLRSFYSILDQSAFPTAIVAVDPHTGAQSRISSGGLFSLPTYLALAPNRQLFVSDLTALGTGAILRIDADTGHQDVVASGGFINGPNVLAFINGFLYVADKYEGLVIIGDGSGKSHAPGVSTLLDGEPRNNFIHRAVTFFTMYSYNFCWPVRTLRTKAVAARTPAMMAKLTDHVWTLAEWLKRPAVQLA